MPIKKSASKELRKAKKRMAANRAYLKRVKDAVKKLNQALKTNKLEEVNELAGKAIQLIDKAAQKNMIHKNKAARKKSRLLAAARGGGDEMRKLSHNTVQQHRKQQPRLAAAAF